MARLPLMSDCPSPIHPNNLNLSFNYSFLSLSSAKLQIKTFLLFSRDSFLILLLLSFFFYCSMKQWLGMIWTQTTFALLFSHNLNNSLMVWTLVCCIFHIFCFALARSSRSNTGGVKTPLISILTDCYFGRLSLCTVLPAIMWNLRGFFSTVSSTHRPLLHKQLVGLVVSGYTWHIGLPVSRFILAIEWPELKEAWDVCRQRCKTFSW